MKLSKPHSFEMLLTGLLCGVVWIIENIRTSVGPSHVTFARSSLQFQLFQRSQAQTAENILLKHLVSNISIYLVSAWIVRRSEAGKLRNSYFATFLEFVPEPARNLNVKVRAVGGALCGGRAVTRT